jgi:hypothetical protein
MDENAEKSGAQNLPFLCPKEKGLFSRNRNLSIFSPLKESFLSKGKKEKNRFFLSAKE